VSACSRDGTASISTYLILETHPQERDAPGGSGRRESGLTVFATRPIVQGEVLRLRVESFASPAIVADRIARYSRLALLLLKHPNDNGKVASELCSAFDFLPPPDASSVARWQPLRHELQECKKQQTGYFSASALFE
jgi:hypothetical protein